MSGGFFGKVKSMLVETEGGEAPEPLPGGKAAPTMSDEEFLKIMKADDQKDSTFKATIAEEAKAAAPPPVEPAPKPQVADNSGNVNFPALYQVGNVPQSAMPAEKCLSLIASLPEGLPAEVKRSTVRISVEAMGGAVGATPQSIVADARAKNDAIASYLASNDADTAQYVQAAESKIRDMEAQVARMKAAISGVQARRERISAICVAEAKRLQEVVGFFAGGEAAAFPSTAFPDFTAH